ncbi:MAG TPA: O-antigen ligase family protein [Bryobacteraceae bacterium]|nr:O-antigen ligase family protein [Bryobacteraceae bacterium]
MQVRSIGLFLLIIYLFFSYSRIVEIGIIKGLPAIFLHVQLVIGILAVIALVGSQRLLNWLSTKEGKYLLLFTAWMFLGIPFSVWRTHSLAIFLTRWVESFLVFTLVTGFCLTTRSLRAVVYTVGLASFCLSLAALAFGSLDTGRLYLLPVGKYSNPNDLALVLLVGLPFLWLLAKSERGMGIGTLVWSGACAAIVWVVLQTGSRGGLVAMLVMVLISFVKASLGKKLILVGVVLTIIPCMFLLMPSSIKARYATLLENGEEIDPSERQAEFAVTSQENRLFLLEKSLLFTARRPIFGGGAGTFTVMIMHEFEDLHITGAHRESHNTYTQISAELGIPALIFFIAALMGNIRRLSRSIGSQLADKPLGIAILLSLLGWCVSAFFNSIAYDGYAPLLLGLSVAFIRVSQEPAGSVEDSSSLAKQPVYNPLARLAGASYRGRTGQYAR